jgi:hypothetical protein
MVTLAADITASQRRITVADPGSPRIGALYRVGDELVSLIGYWKGIAEESVAGDDASTQAWVPDDTRWRIGRGAEATVAVSHASGAALTEWIVTTSTGGGPGGASSLADVLAEGADADGLVITNLGAPVDPDDAATKEYADGIAGFDPTESGAGAQTRTLSLTSTDGQSTQNVLTAAATTAVTNIKAESSGAEAAVNLQPVGEGGSPAVTVHTVDGIGLDGTTWLYGPLIGFYGTEPIAVPEVPAAPLPQDIVDALVALGLVTQAAP